MLSASQLAHSGLAFSEHSSTPDHQTRQPWTWWLRHEWRSI